MLAKTLDLRKDL